MLSREAVYTLTARIPDSRVLVGAVWNLLSFGLSDQRNMTLRLIFTSDGGSQTARIPFYF